MLIPERIREARTRANMSSADVLAQKLDVTPASVRQWERGDGKPRPERWQSIADSLGITIEYLEGKEDYDTARLKFKNEISSDRSLLVTKRLPLAENSSDILDIILLKQRGGDLDKEWNGSHIEGGSLDGDFIVIARMSYGRIEVGDKLCCYIKDPVDGDTVVCKDGSDIMLVEWPSTDVTPLAVVKRVVFPV